MKADRVKYVLSMLIFGSNANAMAEECVFRRVQAFDVNAPYTGTTQEIGAPEIHIYMDINTQLFRRTEDGVARGELIESSISINNDQTLKMKLREDCAWADGTPITAQNVKDGLDMLFSPEDTSYNPGRQFFTKGPQILAGELPSSELGVRVTGQYEIEIDKTAPKDFFEIILTRFNFAPYPSHLTGEALDDWKSGKITRLSSGPYMIEEASEDVLKFVRNPHYCKGLTPQIDRAEIYQANQEKSAAAQFVEGKIDVLDTFDKREYDALLKRLGTDGFRRVSRNDEIMMYLRFEMKNSVFTDNINLRRALAMLIDYEKITYLSGYADSPAKPVKSVSFPYEQYDPIPTSWDSMSDAKKLNTALALFEAEGYSEKNPLELKLLYFAHIPGSANIMNSLRSMWAPLPVNFVFMETESRQFTKDAERQDDPPFDVTLSLFGSDYPDPYDFILGFTDPDSSLAIGDPEGDMYSRVIKSIEISDRQRRYDYLAQLDFQVVERAVIVPLVTISQPWLFQNNVKTGDLFNLSTYNIQKEGCEQI